MRKEIAVAIKFHGLWLFIGLFLQMVNNGLALAVLPVLYSISYLVFWNRRLDKDLVNPGKLLAAGNVIISMANLDLHQRLIAGQQVTTYTYALPEYFNTCHGILFLGIWAILLGYDVGKGRFLKPISFKILKRKHLSQLFIFSMIFTFRKFWLTFSLPGSLQVILTFLPLVSVLFFARLGFSGKFERGKLYAFALAGTQAILGLMFSYLRSEAILPIIVLLLGIFWGAQSFKVFARPILYPVYAAVISFLFFFNILGRIRAEGEYGSNRLAALQELREKENNTIYNTNETNDGAFARSANLAQVSQVVDLRVQHKVSQGETLIILATALIPRFLWPDKPKIALGVWFALNIGLAREYGNWFNNSINMTIPGNAWLDLGWLGMMLLCVIIGYFIRWIWETANIKDEPTNLGGYFLGTYILYSRFMGVGADLQAPITFLSVTLIFWSLFRIIGRYYPRDL